MGTALAGKRRLDRRSKPLPNRAHRIIQPTARQDTQSPRISCYRFTHAFWRGRNRNLTTYRNLRTEHRQREKLLRIVQGQKIAYVTDAAFTGGNVERIARLADDADVFFCEARFLEQDRSRAADRRHLTAHQAGLLAREARARRLVLFHFSTKYHGRVEGLYEEASKAFGKEVGP